MPENKALEDDKKKVNSMKDEADTNWRDHWQDLSDYLFPRKGRFLDKDITPNDGDKRNDNVIDGEGIKAVRTLAAGMQSGFTSPAKPWFTLGPEDLSLREDAQVKKYMSDVTSLMLAVFQKSNFYTSVHSMYSELGAFGTAAMVIEEDFEDIIRCTPLTIGEYYLDTDNKNRVSRFCRIYTMRARNVVKAFGKENVSSNVATLASSPTTENSWVKIAHLVEANDKRDIRKADSKNKPFRSVYYDYSNADDKYLRESGFDIFPVVAPRWDVTGSEVYGRSPGMDALGDVKMLQSLQQDALESLAKINNPPMTGPSTMEDEYMSLVPGSFTPMDTAGSGGPSFTPVHVPDVNQQAVEFKIQAVRTSIKEYMYADLFLLLHSMGRVPGRTATEVVELQEEKLMALGPVIERLQPEMTDPAIDIAFFFIDQAGILPEPPEVLAGKDIKVTMISLLAQAQKAVGISTMERAIRFTGEVAALDPTAIDKLNTPQFIDEVGELLNLPANLISSDEEALAKQEARNAAIQQQETADNLERATRGAKTLSDTSLEGNTALNAIAGGAAGGAG